VYLLLWAGKKRERVERSKAASNEDEMLVNVVMA